jgi:hypothetical protein
MLISAASFDEVVSALSVSLRCGHLPVLLLVEIWEFLLRRRAFLCLEAAMAWNWELGTRYQSHRPGGHRLRHCLQFVREAATRLCALQTDCLGVKGLPELLRAHRAAEAALWELALAVYRRRTNTKGALFEELYH